MHTQYQLHPANVEGKMKKLIRSFAENDLYLALPAKIYGVENYESMQVVTVKPCIDLIYPEYNDTELLSNTLKKVFVKIPSGGGFSIKLPIAVGDLVTLHWSHKDLGDFLDGSGADVSISKEAVANLEDCWVTHGFGTRKSHQNPSQTDFIIEGAATTITITPAGAISIVTTGDSSLQSSSHTITAPTTITGDTSITGTVSCSEGASGTFTNSVTVVNGIVTGGS